MSGQTQGTGGVEPAGPVALTTCRMTGTARVVLLRRTVADYIGHVRDCGGYSHSIRLYGRWHYGMIGEPA